jgi:hypothetical protein
MRRHVVVVAALLLTFWLAWDVSARVHRGEPVVVADTATEAAYADLQEEYAQLLARADRQAGLIGNLQAELAGLRRQQPVRVVVYDTVVRVDTVAVPIRVGDLGGRVEALIAGRPDSTGARVPRLVAYDVSGCDRWWVDGSGSVCERSPWGHLWLGLGAGGEWGDRIAPSAVAWLLWKPSKDSPWSLKVERELERTRIFVGREVRIF